MSMTTSGYRTRANPLAARRIRDRLFYGKEYHFYYRNVLCLHTVTSRRLHQRETTSLGQGSRRISPRKRWRNWSKPWSRRNTHYAKRKPSSKPLQNGTTNVYVRIKPNKSVLRMSETRGMMNRPNHHQDYHKTNHHPGALEPARQRGSHRTGETMTARTTVTGGAGTGTVCDYRAVRLDVGIRQKKMIGSHGWQPARPLRQLL